MFVYVCVYVCAGGKGVGEGLSACANLMQESKCV